MTVPVAADPDPLGMMMAEIVAAGEAKGENRSVVRLDVETAGQQKPACVLDAVTPPLSGVSTMPDQQKMEAAVHEYVAAFEAGSPERVAALFAATATVEDPIGTPPHVGHDAILAFYTASMQTGAKLRLDGPIRIAGDFAAFAFSVLLNMQGKDMRVDVIDTFRFNEANEVIEMKAYFGPTNMHGFA